MTEKTTAKKEQHDGTYILIYLFSWISGLIVYLTLAKKNARMKMHAIQAMLLGLIAIIVSIVLGIIPILSSFIVLIIWIYGIYVGAKAYVGTDVSIPLVTPYAKNHAHNQISTPLKRKQQESKSSDTDALKALKMRYAKGEINKKKYDMMKRELES